MRASLDLGRSHCVGQAGFKLVEVSCLLFGLLDPGVICESSYPARHSSSDPEESECLYTPYRMKVKGGSEILALQNTGLFPRREG